jgi:hypothetical protein
MIAYKLFRQRKDKSLGSLFINRKERLQKGIWLEAKPYLTKGYKFRPGWHVLPKPEAPHLSMKNRVWQKVKIKNYYEIQRPKSQGGNWFIAREMKILDKQ